MRDMIGLGLMAALVGIAASSAQAAPGLEIHHAVARVTIIPEARGDVVVSVVKANAKLPLTVTRVGDVVTIEGNLGVRSSNCHTLMGRPGVTVWGIGNFGYDDLPQIVVHMPRNVKVSADSAVFGQVGPGDSVDLANTGCGDWTVADQTGALRARVTGSGDVHAGAVGSADLRLSGSSDVSLRAARGGLAASISGSGDVNADRVDGPLNAKIAGSGDLRVKGGAVTDMDVSVAGSGNLRFDGVARTLTARVAGSGAVSVNKVTGAVTKQVAGSGDISVGR
jgi:hypothetical protein